jgi:hypothetical protein
LAAAEALPAGLPAAGFSPFGLFALCRSAAASDSGRSGAAAAEEEEEVSPSLDPQPATAIPQASARASRRYLTVWAGRDI